MVREGEEEDTGGAVVERERRLMGADAGGTGSGDAKGRDMAGER